LHPVLFEVFGVPVTAYGSALAVSFALGIALAMRRAGAAGLDPDVIPEAGLVALASSLVGARLLFALEQPELFAAPGRSWLDLVRPLPREGMQGLSMSLGVVLAVVTVLGWLRFRGQPVLRAADVMAPSVALGEAITRLGCFMNGCCHGVACDWPWAVRFPAGSFAQRALGDVAVHPTQLYTALVSAALFVGLIRLSRRGLAPGTVFFAFLLLWALARLALDTLRFYPDAVALWPGSHLPVARHHVFVALLACVGAAGLVWLRRASVQHAGDA